MKWFLNELYFPFFARKFHVIIRNFKVVQNKQRQTRRTLFSGFKKGKLDGNDDFRNLNQAATFFKATSERLRLFLSNFSRVCQVKNKVDLLSLSLLRILHVYRLPGSFTSTIKVGCTLTTRSHSPLVTPANFSKLTIDDCSHCLN